MKRIVVPVAIVALVALGVWWFSPTRVLKRHVAAFVRTANVPAEMGDLGRGARGRHVAGFLADSVTVAPPEALADDVDREYSRDRASALYSVVAKYCREISITDLAFESVGIDGATATVDFSADAIVDLPGRRPVDGIIRARTAWEKTGDGWQLRHFGWEEHPRR